MILLESTYPEAKNKALNNTMIAEQNEKWDQNIFFSCSVFLQYYFWDTLEKKTHIQPGKWHDTGAVENPIYNTQINHFGCGTWVNWGTDYPGPPTALDL